MALVSYALPKFFLVVDHAARILRNQQRKIDATCDSFMREAYGACKRVGMTSFMLRQHGRIVTKLNENLTVRLL
jgi:hypothetical protein